MPRAASSLRDLDREVPALLHQFGFTGPPGLVEPGLQGPVEAEEHVPALAGDSLNPVVLRPPWLTSTENFRSDRVMIKAG